MTEIMPLVDQLKRALVHVEWNDNHGGDPCTSCCTIAADRAQPVHRPWCLVDAALTAAGLPDQESRDALRVVIGMEGRT